MGFRINQLYIKNFKVFDEIHIEFEDADLLLLDGPNGFGKTTICDAVELVLTGRIQRIDNTRIVTRAVTFKDFPYYKNPESEIVLKLEFIGENEKFTLLQYLPPKLGVSPKDHKANNWNLFQWKQLSHFSESPVNGKKITSKDVNTLFATNVAHDFGIFHYIQQEDNAYFFRKNEKERMDLLGHLFDTAREEANLKTLESHKKELRRRLDVIQNDIESQMSAMEDMGELVANADRQQRKPYKSILQGLPVERIWDGEQFAISDNDTRVRIVNEIEALINFVRNFENFQKYQSNQYAHSVVQNQDFLFSIVCAYNFRHTLADMESLEAERSQIAKLYQQVNILHQQNEVPLDLLSQLDFAMIASEFGIEIDTLQESIEAAIVQRSKISESSRVLYDLGEIRNRTKIAIQELHDVVEHDKSTCPVCGYDWKHISNLMEQIEITNEGYRNNFDNHTEEFETSMKAIRQYVMSLNGSLRDILEDPKFTNLERNLRSAKVLNREHTALSTFESWCQSHEINIERAAAKSYEDRDLDGRLSSLVEQILAAIKGGEEENSFADEEYLFSEFFRRNSEHVNKLAISDLREKIEYINQSYFFTNSKKLQQIRMSLDSLVAKREKITTLLARIQKIISVYKNEIPSHWRKVIKDIEIPFFIYSGRIVQNYHRGLGIFIKEEAQNRKSANLRFVPGAETDHDAMHTLSSGQIAGMVIAFTLALNRIYSSERLPLICIDDPIQTMDDINMSALVEVLRSEFSRRQLILSTHEDHPARYIRYKYRKHGLKEKRINLQTILKG